MTYLFLNSIFPKQLQNSLFYVKNKLMNKMTFNIEKILEALLS